MVSCSFLVLELISINHIVLNYYGPRMYESLGLSSGQALLVQGIFGAVGPIANFL